MVMAKTYSITDDVIKTPCQPSLQCSKICYPNGIFLQVQHFLNNRFYQHVPGLTSLIRRPIKIVFCKEESFVRAARSLRAYLLNATNRIFKKRENT